MKTLAGAMLALGVLSTAASAQYCPGQGYGTQRPTYSRLTRPVEKPQPPATTPEVPVDPAPTEPVPQK